MPDIGGILNIGRQGLLAHQAAIAVTSGNIANVNTPGYNRQEPIYETTSPNGIFGNGVRVEHVRSVVDTYLQRQIISGQSTLGRFATEKGVMDRVESIFSDAEGGINGAIDDFFAAVQDVQNNASETAPRNILLERGRSLSQTIHSDYAQLQSISRDMNGEITARVDEVNALASQIARLNKQIQMAEGSGGNPANDLRMNRDNLLGELSKKIEVRLLDEAGGVTVMVGSGGRTVALVSGERAYSLSASSGGKILSNGTDITSSIADGQLGGLIALRDNVLPAYMDRLDKLSASIIVGFNTQHEKGFALDGSTGNDFFSPLPLTLSEPDTNIFPTIADASALTFDDYEISFSQGQYAMRNLKTGAEAQFIQTESGYTTVFEGIAVDIAGDGNEGDRLGITIPYQGMAGKIAVALTDSSKIAAASSAEALPGGNGNAVLLANLQEQQFFSLAATFQGFFANFTGEVGSRVQLAQQNLSVQQALSGNLDTMREGISGVSLDEEFANLISFQRAYQASAKLVATADELLQTVIGMKQ